MPQVSIPPSSPMLPMDSIIPVILVFRAGAAPRAYALGMIPTRSGKNSRLGWASRGIREETAAHRSGLLTPWVMTSALRMIIRALLSRHPGLSRFPCRFRRAVSTIRGSAIQVETHSRCHPRARMWRSPLSQPISPFDPTVRRPPGIRGIWLFKSNSRQTGWCRQLIWEIPQPTCGSPGTLTWAFTFLAGHVHSGESSSILVPVPEI